MLTPRPEMVTKELRTTTYGGIDKTMVAFFAESQFPDLQDS
jgi:hypothetical protein